MDPCEAGPLGPMKSGGFSHINNGKNQSLGDYDSRNRLGNPSAMTLR